MIAAAVYLALNRLPSPCLLLIIAAPLFILACISSIETLRNSDRLGNPSLVSSVPALGGYVSTTTATTCFGNDGSSSAPSGSAQYPTLLAGETSTIKGIGCKVAAVDYAVGYPSGQTFTDPTISPPANTSYNSSTHILSCTADNVVIDGYDLTVSNGIQISCTNNNLTLRNSKMGGSNYLGLSTGPIDFRGTTLTINNNVIDGGCAPSGGPQSTLIYLNPSSDSGAVLLKYNWLKNYCQHIIETRKSVALTEEWNLIDLAQMNTFAHENWSQFEACGTSTATILFNTANQNSTPNGSEGWQFYCNTSGGMTSADVEGNTVVTAKSGGSFTMSNIMHGSVLGATGTMINNYFDLTGTSGAAFYPSSFGGWTSSSSNIDMVSGATITFPPP